MGGGGGGAPTPWQVEEEDEVHPPHGRWRCLQEGEVRAPSPGHSYPTLADVEAACERGLYVLLGYIEVQNQVKYGGQMDFFSSCCFRKLLNTEDQKWFWHQSLALDRFFSWH